MHRLIPFVLLASAALPAAAADCSVSLAQAFEAAGGARWAAIREQRIEGAIEIPGLTGKFGSVGDREEDGAKYSVHAIEPQGGRPFELWIDAKTKLIARRVSRNGPVEQVARYSDYRDVDGVKVMHAIEQKASNAPMVTKLKVE